MIRRPPRSTLSSSSAASDVYKRQFRACVGYAKENSNGEIPDVIHGEPTKEYYVAPSMMIEPFMRMKFPVQHGIVDSWEDMEKIWGHLFYDRLKASVGHVPSGSDDIYGDEEVDIDAVLMTEAAMNPKYNREQCTAIMFEKFQVDKFFLAIQAILALYSSGRMTGLALDVGEGVTHTVPIFEGYTMSHAVTRHNLAGRDLTNYTIRLLGEACGCYLTTSSEKEMARRIKEELCYVSQDYDTEMVEYSKQNVFEFPDGQEIAIKDVAIRVPELLFNPRMHNMEYAGLPELVANTILNCDLDVRRELWSSILLSGGTTCFKGLQLRLENEAQALNPYSPVHVIASEEQKYAVWQGGSILASLSTFEKQWMRRTTDHTSHPTVPGYDECGARMVHMLCSM
eukprot:TRINITY_DN50462_c0_g1_i1.p1 TRINITY_DN50462_c0_g1~~TRINITY_DN50462_c0_g1_i1.p1  ORF type:complete len:397 (-),score=95.86 TRINITY_DN50462_c0_g1_i1:124-1314(-)